MLGALRSHIDRRTLIAIRNLLRSIRPRFTSTLTMSEASRQEGGESTGRELQFDPSRPAVPISYPLKTLEELESRAYFDSFHYPFNVASVSLRSRELPDRPRMLVCHDMAGGYGDDKWVQGGDNAGAYAIWHWYLIDVFVYFSHSLVTLPPPGWVNTAHRHGVKVLGTFITEWDEGRAISNKLLATRESAHMYADRLAELAAALGFDGWLINMEVQLDKEQIPNLKEFVSRLTERMHAAVAHSLVIWYDSVTIDGELSWQDQLNDKNKPFFDICDGIFVNYTWKENYPKLSGLAAGDRKFDVYMGIDAFGRGSYGGGQWNINAALDVLKQERVSAALFAPGWVYESNQPPDFPTGQNRWWSLIEKSWGIRGAYPDKLPFCINFDQGRGFHIYVDGRLLSDKQWCNISLQSLQPLLSISEESAHTVEASIDLEEESYSGGGCIALKGTLGDEAYCVTRLFQGELCLGESPVTFTYSVKIKSTESSRVCLSVDLVSTSNEKSSILLASWGDNLITMSQFANKFSKIIMPQRVTRQEDAPGWIIHESSLSMKGYMLANINAVCYKSSPGLVQKRLDYVSERQGTTSENPSGFHALLGHIKATSAQPNSSFPPQTSWQVGSQFIMQAKDYASSRTISLKIVWKLKTDTDIVFSHFNIFVIQVQKLANGDSNDADHHSVPVFLGVTHTKAFYVSDLAILPGTHCLEFIIQVSLLDGTYQSLEDSPKLSLDVEG
uniref:mannosyl-glycoprotein endo-beta-N-acetylglucosaminidase n=1 Tax=Kalanchoe fedtschenkoi TaxID=63787 RepID=A0A7N0THI6_KALFE